MKRVKRNPHEIIMEILRIAQVGIRKTAIMYKVNLSFRQLQEYLEALNEAGFLEKNQDVWQTTENGLAVIKACELCHRLMEKTAK